MAHGDAATSKADADIEDVQEHCQGSEVSSAATKKENQMNAGGDEEEDIHETPATGASENPLPLDTDIGQILACTVLYATNLTSASSEGDMLESTKELPPNASFKLRDSMSSLADLSESRASLADGSSLLEDALALHKTDSLVHSMAIQASNGALESTTCTVYFPYIFEKLRKLIEYNGNQKFMDSLMKSHSVEMTGGQVGSFLKTKDDRFIIKVIKKEEAQAFGRHAKEYAEYIYKRVANPGDHPTALVKILGFFKIRHTHVHKSQYILVMENLFPKQRFSQIDHVFDLKGCTYGRRQKEEGATGFERNLMEYTGGSPLLLTPAAKAKFNQAVRQDTAFLQHLQVVDYSLLLGVDTTNKLLVVGIVDYCREYSLGLRIYGSMTAGRTIIAPKDYRTRFCDQMDRFLMHVPSFYENLATMQSEHDQDSSRPVNNLSQSTEF